MTNRARARATIAALVAAAALPLVPAAAQEVHPRAPAAAADAASREPLAERARDYAEARRPFFEARLPEALRQPGPRGLLWWQWLALPTLLVIALVAGALLGWLSRVILAHVVTRTRTPWDDRLLDKVTRPLTALWAVAVVTALHPWLLLDDAAAGVLQRVLRAAAYLVLLWGGMRAVEVGFTAAAEAPASRASANLSGLLPVARKVSKVALVAIGLTAVLDSLGFQVASLLAGLGIGGIAVAFGAQKTVENVFGSLAIGVDQVFRVGDTVRVDDFVGTVERIGMRSTRFRTPDRTLITIPNGKLSDSRTETFAARDRIRLFTNLGLTYGTTAAQLREVVTEIEAALRSHPKVFPEGIGVRFSAFQESALNVEVMAYFQTLDWDEFSAIRTDLFLRFMEIVERAGTTLAFPTRTVHLVSHEVSHDRASERAG
jgi:MscS family membrane protein